MDIVSIDVEGWELDVLRGFSVERYRPQVLIVENVFAENGYRHALGARGYRLWRHVAPNDVYVPAGTARVSASEARSTTTPRPRNVRRRLTVRDVSASSGRTRRDSS